MIERIEKEDRVEYRLDGALHRLDGPAVERDNGDKEWWVNGKRHRLDGPAIDCANGDYFWYKDGLLHREDGPAISVRSTALSSYYYDLGYIPKFVKEDWDTDYRRFRNRE